MGSSKPVEEEPSRVPLHLLRDRLGARWLRQRRGLNLEIHAHNLVRRTLPTKYGALAKLRELQVGRSAQFHAGSDKDAVDLQARSPLEFKEQVYQAGISRAAAQHPPATCEDRPSHSLNQAARFLAGNRSNLHRPGNRHGLHFVARNRLWSHVLLIGGAAPDLRAVRKRDCRHSSLRP